MRLKTMLFLVIVRTALKSERISAPMRGLDTSNIVKQQGKPLKGKHESENQQRQSLFHPRYYA